MRFRRDKKIISTFQHAALTDIIFLLLIFFLLSSTFVFQPGVKVDLPAASKADLESRQNVLVTLTKSGDYYVNDQKVPLSDLGPALAGRLKGNRDKTVVFKADGQVDLDHLVAALDIARQAGAARLAIATKPKPLP